MCVCVRKIFVSINNPCLLWPMFTALPNSFTSSFAFLVIAMTNSLWWFSTSNKYSNLLPLRTHVFMFYHLHGSNHLFIIILLFWLRFCQTQKAKTLLISTGAFWFMASQLTCTRNIVYYLDKSAFMLFHMNTNIVRKAKLKERNTIVCRLQLHACMRMLCHFSLRPFLIQMHFGLWPTQNLRGKQTRK